MDDIDFDFDLDDVGGGVTLVAGDEEDFSCDDVRPAWLGAELMNLDAETQIGFNAVYSDR
ncbi:MAG TPA: hypothetical protein VLW55_02500 [Burkholderiaceae bacterium]|nr:hypothetical protein [Burkholderiaceae bacterium]